MSVDSLNSNGDAVRRSSTPRRPRAGEAYMQAVSRDPAARAVLRRVQKRLQVIANVFQSPEFRRVWERSKQEQQQAIEEFTEELRKSLCAAGDEVAARGHPDRTPTRRNRPLWLRPSTQNLLETNRQATTATHTSLL